MHLHTFAYICIHVICVCGSKPLPEPVDGQHVQNELDIQLRHYRETEMYHIRKTGKQLRDNATNVADAMQDVEGFLALLKNLAIEVLSLRLNTSYIVENEYTHAYIIIFYLTNII